MSMRDLLEAQRAAFMAELPVSLDARRDRLKRAIAMISANADRLCDALSEDFGHRSRDQSMITDIAASVAPLRHALKHVARWSRPARKPVLFPLGLLALLYVRVYVLPLLFTKTELRLLDPIVYHDHSE